MTFMKKARFLIAGLVIEIDSAPRGGDSAPRGGGFEIPPAYQPFLADSGKTDFLLETRDAGIPRWQGELLFDSGGPWRLWRSDRRYLITLHNLARSEDPYQIAFLDQNFDRGETFFDSEIEKSMPGFFPFSYPLDEVVVVNRLGLGHGLEVHAAGIDVDGAGILFLGASGAGKSTLSRLWEAEGAAAVLSDDRIIITRRGEGGFNIHGTPWHGEAGLAAAAGAPLKSIFFLKQAAANSHQSLGPAQIASRILATCFPTFWNETGMQFSAGLAAEIAQAVPGYELGFTPGPAAVEHVRNIPEPQNRSR